MDRYKIHAVKHIFVLLAIITIGMLPLSNTFAADPAAGEKLWKANCVSCHKVHKKLVGPALVGVNEKYEKEWLYKWIRNSQAFIKEGDQRANAIYKEYKNSVMTAFPTLSNEDIDNILAYVDTAPPPEEGAGADGAAAGAGGDTQMGWTPSNLFMAIMGVILLAIIFILARLLSSLNNMIRERRGLPKSEPFSFGKIYRNRAFRLTTGLAMFALLAYTTYDNAGSLGRQEGYQPDQPIKFSHKLHAGKYGIECQYCHVGANRGKSAVIPSANICMNCHKQVQEGPTYGKKEIQKIYDAVGFDPVKKEYIEGYEQKPIEWVRIHNLPDHVYFSHAQHVNAGQIECQQCHGEIQEMEVVGQHSSLGMGWCIDCHRETEVNFQGNEYYSVYAKFHEQIKNGERTGVTVEDIGGLECQKCHY